MSGRMRRSTATGPLMSSPTTPVVLRVGTAADDAVLEVEDAGPGIATADAQRVFERFYRADASRTRASGGTGLGLTLTRNFCRLLGGSLEVKSEFGVGTTFTVRLPRAPGELSRSLSG